MKNLTSILHYKVTEQWKANTHTHTHTHKKKEKHSENDKWAASIMLLYNSILSGGLSM